MFDNLSDRLQGIFSGLRGKGRLTEDDINTAMREVRMAMLEADVNFKVVKQFVARTKERCLDAEVLDSLSPTQNVIKIVTDELTELLGRTDSKLVLSSRIPNVIMLVGLQGSGKTTAAAKLAYRLKQEGHSPLLAACDVYRPAAADQLETLGNEIGVRVFRGDGKDPVAIAKGGVQDAIDADVLKRRDTLEELEADLGFAPGVLTDAVAKWNECCERGEDDFMYPMPPEWLHAITKPPFYGCRIGGNLYGTKAGLLINDQMQVVGTNGLVIPGLYAGWHTAGGACGENSYIGDPILGSLMGDVGLAFCGGYLCGTSAVEHELQGAK